MTNEERELQRKLRVLRHAEQSGHVSKTCRCLGICRASFYRWRAAYLRDREAGSVNRKAILKTVPNRTSPDRGEGPSSTSELPSGANQQTEAQYTIHPTCAPEDVPDVRDLLFDTLEAEHYPVREVEVLTEGDDVMELGADASCLQLYRARAGQGRDHAGDGSSREIRDLDGEHVELMVHWARRQRRFSHFGYSADVNG